MKHSTFYAKKANTALLLKDFIELLPNGRYRLKGGFDDFYFGSLHVWRGRDWLKPADTMADALCYLATYWTRVQYGHLPKDPRAYLQFHREPWKGVDEELQQFMKSRSLSMPTLLYAVSDNNTLAEATCSEPIERPLEVGLSFPTLLQEPPGMTIKISGNPAAVFMSCSLHLEEMGAERAHREHPELYGRATTLLHSFKESGQRLQDPAIPGGRGKQRIEQRTPSCCEPLRWLNPLAIDELHQLINGLVSFLKEFCLSVYGFCGPLQVHC